MQYRTLGANGVKAPLDEELLTDVLKILEPVHQVTWPSSQPENN